MCSWMWLAGWHTQAHAASIAAACGGEQARLVGCVVVCAAQCAVAAGVPKAMYVMWRSSFLCHSLSHSVFVVGGYLVTPQARWGHACHTCLEEARHIAAFARLTCCVWCLEARFEGVYGGMAVLAQQQQQQQQLCEACCVPCACAVYCLEVRACLQHQQRSIAASALLSR